MDRTAFLKELKSNSLSGVYIFEGKEEYLKEQTIKQLEGALLPAGFETLNETILDAPGIDAIYDSALAVPFMCDKRLVIAKDPPFLIRKKGDDDKPKEEAKGNKEPAKKELNEKLEYLNKQNPDCIVILCLRADMPRAKISGVTLEDKVVSFEPMRDYDLGNWIRDELKEALCSASGDAIQALIASCNRDMTRIGLELNKLTAYKGSGGRIDIKDVQQLVTPDLETSVFDMINALLRGDEVRAYEILNNMLEHHESCVMILYMITRQMRLMCYAKSMQEGNVPNSQMLEALEIRKDSSFQLTKALEQAGRYRADTLTRLYKRSVEYETAIKTGAMGEKQGLDEMLTLIGSEFSKTRGNK